MKIPTRSILGLSVVAVLLVACGAAGDPDPSTAPSETPTPTLEPSVPPSEAPAETPDETPGGAPVPSGTFTFTEGAVVDGPGIPLAEALEGDLSQPILVRGTLYRDADGNVWFAESVTDASVPTFSDLRLAVANYPTDGPTWDMADAEIKGLQEVNGIRFFEDTKLYGTITP
jgi:hypothetical protein